MHMNATSRNGTLRPRTAGRRKDVLLALGFYTHARHAGIVRYAREANWTLDCRLLAFRSPESRHIEYLKGAHYDGVIAYLTETSPELRRVVRALNVPVVDLGMDVPEFKCPRVVADNEAIGRQGAEYLLGRGFRDLLFYTHYLDTYATRTRLSAFVKAVEAAGARCKSLIWSDRPRGKRNLDRLTWLTDEIRTMPQPLAVMTLNDHVAVEVLKACEVAGLSVPEQVAVLGVDNDELVVDLTSTPISSVDSNRELIGYEAAAMLDQLMSGMRVPRQPVFVPPRGIVTRKSTDILAVNDSDVAFALRYIWEHFSERISVDDVARQTMLSRRYLQDRFFKQIGRTIYDEITLQRLNHAKKRLAETDIKAHIIAREAGFGRLDRMSKVFSRLLGVGPKEYRERHRRGLSLTHA
jgi:LacI family transcriptional regulator